jgi:hypothetical protein
LATAQALGGFRINAPLPEINHLLFEASSQAATPGGRNGGDPPSFLVVFECLANGVAFDGEVAVGANKFCAE